ncbi:UDP-glucose 4-epimerase GalE [Candidatus Dependentiae bacterium]|nr:UDP-glucose 4-epimerase GalE [Candidatus Dependentiae bacterium]
MKTILVTGGAGYIGSAVALEFSKNNFNVIVLDDLLYDQKFNFSWTKFYKADFADTQILKQIFNSHKIDAVVHCAAFIEVGKSVKDPKIFYENNVIKTIKLLDFLFEHDVKKFIFSSSCAVYGIPENLPLREDHIKKPISPYGNTKLIVEMVLSDYANAYGLNSVCLRYFNAAGAIPEENIGELHEPETHLIPLILDAAYNQKTFNVFGNDYKTPDGSCIRDYLHIKDIADAHLKSYEYLNVNNLSENFNLGTGRGYSVLQVIDAVKKITGQEVKFQIQPKRSGDPDILIADASKANNILNWDPRYSDLKNIVQDAADFYLKNNLFFLRRKSISNKFIY